MRESMDKIMLVLGLVCLAMLVFMTACVIAKPKAWESPWPEKDCGGWEEMQEGGR